MISPLKASSRVNRLLAALMILRLVPIVAITPDSNGDMARGSGRLSPATHKESDSPDEVYRNALPILLSSETFRIGPSSLLDVELLENREGLADPDLPGGIVSHSDASKLQQLQDLDEKMKNAIGNVRGERMLAMEQQKRLKENTGSLDAQELFQNEKKRREEQLDAESNPAFIEEVPGHVAVTHEEVVKELPHGWQRIRKDTARGLNGEEEITTTEIKEKESILDAEDLRNAISSVLEASDLRDDENDVQDVSNAPSPQGERPGSSPHLIEGPKTTSLEDYEKRGKGQSIRDLARKTDSSVLMNFLQKTGQLGRRLFHFASVSSNNEFSLSIWQWIYLLIILPAGVMLIMMSLILFS